MGILPFCMGAGAGRASPQGVSWGFFGGVTGTEPVHACVQLDGNQTPRARCTLAASAYCTCEHACDGCTRGAHTYRVYACTYTHTPPKGFLSRFGGAAGELAPPLCISPVCAASLGLGRGLRVGKGLGVGEGGGHTKAGPHRAAGPCKDSSNKIRGEDDTQTHYTHTHTHCTPAPGWGGVGGHAPPPHPAWRVLCKPFLGRIRGLLWVWGVVLGWFGVFFALSQHVFLKRCGGCAAPCRGGGEGCPRCA